MRSVFYIIFLIAAISCNKKGPAGPAGPQGPKGETGAQGTSPTGTISGKILQFDAYGVWQNSGLNTTSVSIAGTDLLTVTDAVGNYTLSNVPAGVYELNVRRPNSGLGRIMQVVFPGEGELYKNGNIADRAPYEFIGGYIRDTANSTLKVNLYFSPSPKTRSYVILFSRTPAIDPEDPKTFQVSNSYNLYANASSQQDWLGYSSMPMLNSAYGWGSKIFCNVYPCCPAAGRYFDPIDKKYVYPGCGAPLGPVQSFTLQ